LEASKKTVKDFDRKLENINAQMDQIGVSLFYFYIFFLLNKL
jgi:uncharacterized protein with GYD domain